MILAYFVTAESLNAIIELHDNLQHHLSTFQIPLKTTQFTRWGKRKKKTYLVWQRMSNVFWVIKMNKFLSSWPQNQASFPNFTSIQVQPCTKVITDMLQIVILIAMPQFNIQKTEIIASSPITSWEIDGETVETDQTLFFCTPKSLQMVTAVMKLKDAYSLEEKL